MTLQTKVINGLVAGFLIFCSLYCINKEKQYGISKAKELRAMGDTVVMDYGDYEVVLPPEVYFSGGYCDNLFAVPNDNMVGTNDFDNAIKLLEFKTSEELSSHTVRKDFMEMVNGPFEFRFLPVWSKKEIAYSQSKGFLIVNIPDKKVEIYTISPGIYSGDIENISILDADKRIFVFELLNSSGDEDGNVWNNKVLRVIQFTNNSFTVLAEHPAGKKTSAYTEPWFVYDKKIFIYNDSTTKIEVFDETFKTISHPIATVFNNNHVAFRCMREIVVHPTMPFALIVEQGKFPKEDAINKVLSLPANVSKSAVDALLADSERKSFYLFRWTEQDPQKQLIPLVSIAGSIWKSFNPQNSFSQFTFSPDGKWVVFRDETESTSKPDFVAIPVSPKNPLYLGKPVKLGKILREDAHETEGTAWTTNPTAYVVSDGMLLYRWNLDRIPSLRRVVAPK
jgi:hypothetical protein